MFWMVLVHTVLVLWSAFFMSKEIWAFISSFLLLIMMGVYLGFELIRQKLKSKRIAVYSDDEEWLPMVDEEGRILGKALRSYCHNGSKTLHPVVHLHLLGNNHTPFSAEKGNYKTDTAGEMGYRRWRSSSLWRNHRRFLEA